MGNQAYNLGKNILTNILYFTYGSENEWSLSYSLRQASIRAVGYVNIGPIIYKRNYRVAPSKSNLWDLLFLHAYWSESFLMSLWTSCITMKSGIRNKLFHKDIEVCFIMTLSIPWIVFVLFFVSLSVQINTRHTSPDLSPLSSSCIMLLCVVWNWTKLVSW
jgi:hypothetical protein